MYAVVKDTRHELERLRKCTAVFLVFVFVRTSMCVYDIENVCDHKRKYSVPASTLSPQVQLVRVYLKIIAFPGFTFYSVNISARVGSPRRSSVQQR